jgi:hypothetical protein
MSDSPTCKQQKTAKEEEAPNSLLSLPIETLQYCIAFVGKGHYRFVGSVCKQINKIYANEDEDMKVTFWSNVAVNRNLAKLCFKDHQKLGQRIDEMQSMVANIGEVAAKSGNVKVFKWALWNEYFHEEYWDDDVFIDVAENGHVKILELADKKEGLDWYSRDILVDAAARNDWELLDFLLQKKPNQFDLSFTKMCVREGFIEVMDWWKEVELIELIREAAYSGQWRMLDNLYNNEYQQASSDLKEFLQEMIVHWAASAGQIDVLEWARDRGMHGDTETCMWAATYHGHLHVLQWLQKDGATWDSHVISCAEEGGYDYVVEWARENGCHEP